jgi:chromosome segregation ATPase
MKKLLFLVIVMLATKAHGQSTTTKASLEKLKTNLSNAKLNLVDYEKNSKVVDGNVLEISKAKAQLDQQRSTMRKSLEENTKKLQTLEKSEQEISMLISAEQKEAQAEEAKIQELTQIVNQLKANQAKRTQNITTYQEQAKQILQEKAEWRARGDQISKSNEQLDNRARNLQVQETEWKNKQKGYQGEVSRWQKEVARQQKLNDNYNSLAEVKE